MQGELISKYIRARISFSDQKECDLGLFDTEQEAIEKARKMFGQYPGTRLIIAITEEYSDLLILWKIKK